jgi:glutamate formiminotransferase/formiminotetrahydrofolate cyclodeaminase
MAAGLAAMVAGMSRGKKAYAAFDTELTEALAKLRALREELKAAIDADAASYQAVVAAYKAEKNPAPGVSPETGAAAVAAALRGAAGVPLRVAEASAEVGSLVAALRSKTNPKMASDLTVAAALAGAAVEGALANVEINLESLDADTDAEFIRETQAKVAGIRNFPK